MHVHVYSFVIDLLIEHIYTRWGKYSLYSPLRKPCNVWNFNSKITSFASFKNSRIHKHSHKVIASFHNVYPPLQLYKWQSSYTTIGVLSDISELCSRITNWIDYNWAFVGHGTRRWKHTKNLLNLGYSILIQTNPIGYHTFPGSRIIILNTIAPYARVVLEQAARLDMTDPGWGWIVTDGVTSMVSYVNSGY